MRETTAFLKILYGFVHGTDPALCAAPQFDALYEIANRQALLPVLAYANKQWHFFSETQTEYLNAVLRQTVFALAYVAADFEALSKQLSDAGIDHMPCKGWYLRELYPLAELRTYGDIDILIHPADRKRVDSLLRKQGFQSKVHWEPTYAYVRDTEHYEFHTNLMDGNLDGRFDYQGFFSDAWHHASLCSGSCYTPEAQYHFIYALCHLAKHLNQGGAGLRMYLDLALFIEKYNQLFDWNAIGQTMAQMKLERFYATVLSALAAWFGVTANTEFCKADAQILDALAQYTFQGDVFGEGHDVAVISARGAASPHALGTFLGDVFPPASRLVKRYTYLERHRWLLPVAWVDRVFRNAGLIKSHMKQISDISSKNGEEIRDYQSFMEQIGL